MSGMAEVLTAHQRQNSSSCLCGWSELGKSHPEHQAGVLSAAGFGPVKEARAGTQEHGEDLTAVIHARRRRKCIAAGEHLDQPPDGPEAATCPRCGL
jgi:hypothetical protein